MSLPILYFCSFSNGFTLNVSTGNSDLGWGLWNLKSRVHEYFPQVVPAFVLPWYLVGALKPAILVRWENKALLNYEAECRLSF